MHVEGPSTRDAPEMKNPPSACAPRLKVSPEMMFTSPRASGTSPKSRHSACCLPQQLVLYYHDVELLQLEQERKPARMSVKTYVLLFHTMAIDRPSHMHVSQERESTISVLAERCSATKTLTHNSATAPGSREVRTQRNFFQYGGRSRNKMALRFAYGQWI